jgi:hypothetical protein
MKKPLSKVEIQVMLLAAFLLGVMCEHCTRPVVDVLVHEATWGER